MTVDSRWLATYEVDVADRTCTCPDWVNRAASTCAVSTSKSGRDDSPGRTGASRGKISAKLYPPFVGRP